MTTHGVSGDNTPNTNSSNVSQTSSDIQKVTGDLTEFQINALAIIAVEDRYGGAVKEELEQYYQREFTHGRLYPNLDTLVEEGLVEKGSRDRRTNNYAITPKGESVLDYKARWLVERIDGFEIAIESTDAAVDDQDGTEDRDQNDGGVALPDGVTVDDVETAAIELETLGDVAEKIDITRGRARSITVALNCYSQVRDAPSSEVGR